MQASITKVSGEILKNQAQEGYIAYVFEFADMQAYFSSVILDRCGCGMKKKKKKKKNLPQECCNTWLT